MTQNLTETFHIHALLNASRGKGMSKHMEISDGQAVVSQELPETILNGARIQRMVRAAEKIGL